jgi:CHASE2 domain-containing sensor protein/class 3 adenylate cyclase
MDRFLRAAAVALFTGLAGIAGALSPAVLALEESAGLRLLFFTRALVVAPPPQPPVVVVSIDDAAAIRRNLPDRVSEWPRSIHGELVDRLMELGASAVAFDVEFFRDGDPREDARFADAIRRSGRVVLVQRFRAIDAGGRQIWERQDPIRPLALAAAALAPAPLPDVASVGSYWTYLQTPVAGHVATLPTAALQVHGRSVGIPFNVASHPAYFNFYGPPGTVCTVPYDEVLDGTPSEACQITGRAVFVGAGFSRAQRPDQPDSYHTVYPTEIDFSGVELHATAFANLLTGDVLQPARSAIELLTLLLFGMLAGGVTYLTRTRRRYAQPAVRGRAEAATIAVALAAGYGLVAFLSFSALAVVLPVVIPLAIQAPIAALLALVVPPVTHSEHLRCVCLSTDIEGSTRTNATAPAAVVGRAMRAYASALDAVIRAGRGEPVELRGDGKTCVWIVETPSTQSELAARRQACLTALAAHEALVRFDDQWRPQGVTLPTRMALDVGRVTVTSEADRGLVNVVGSAADVAAVLQKENAKIRGRILATAAVVDGLEDTVITRGLGTLFVSEKLNAPVRVVEVLAAFGTATDRDRDLCRRFQAAVRDYDSGATADATIAFEALSRDFPDDGPTRWCLNRLGHLTKTDRAPHGRIARAAR